MLRPGLPGLAPHWKILCGWMCIVYQKTRRLWGSIFRAEREGQTCKIAFHSHSIDEGEGEEWKSKSGVEVGSRESKSGGSRTLCGTYPPSVSEPRSGGYSGGILPVQKWKLLVRPLSERARRPFHNCHPADIPRLQNAKTILTGRMHLVDFVLAYPWCCLIVYVHYTL